MVEIRLSLARRLDRTRSPPPGAETAGVKRGKRRRKPTSPSHCRAMGPALSAQWAEREIWADAQQDHSKSYRPVTTSLPIAVRPYVSGSYMSSTSSAGYLNVPGVTARTT